MVVIFWLAVILPFPKGKDIRKTETRLGGAALLLAASKTPLAEQLSKKNYRLFEWLQKSNEWNSMNLDKDGNLQYSSFISSNIDMQRYYISTILEKLEEYTTEKIPNLYRQLGKEILTYCDDFEAVLLGKKDLRILMDRADWAIKLHAIRHKMDKDSTVKVGDYRSRLLDMQYDQTVIDSNSRGEKTIRHGYGTILTKRNSKHSLDFSTPKKPLASNLNALEPKSPRECRASPITSFMPEKLGSSQLIEGCPSLK